MKNIDYELIEWAKERIQKKYPEDVALLDEGIDSLVAFLRISSIFMSILLMSILFVEV